MNIWRVILVACLVLAGCTDSEKKQEEKLIKDYEFYIEKVMFTHSQNLAVTQSIEDMHKNHFLLLKDLNKIKDEFTGFAGKDRLHKIVTIYHDALSYFILRQLQIIELGKPIWTNDISMLESLKDEQFYQKHQLLLSNLLSMIDEFDDLMMTHHETIRMKIVSSGLTQQDREKLWSFFNDISAKHLKSMSVTLQPIKIRAEGQVGIAQFLHENKGDYKADPEQGLIFSSELLAGTYNRLIDSIVHKLNIEKVYR